MSFYRRKYALDIYADNSKEIVIMKSVQCGMTEWLIIETFTKCEQGLSVFYVLPKYTLRNSFVANRIDKTINMIPYYRNRIKHALGDADSKDIKHFSNGTIKFASSRTDSDFLEFPADMAIIDELDRCDQKNIEKAADRLSASEYKLFRKISNPTISGFGIAEEFKRSDQKEWFVKCDHCGEWQRLDFFRNVVDEQGEGEFVLRDRDWNAGSAQDIDLICVKCCKPLDRFSDHAEWVKARQDSRVSGYHISKLIDPGTSIVELWEKWQMALANETKKQVFFNSDLGLPYESKGAKLTDALLDKCIRDYVMPSTGSGCVMGVDVGSVLHVSISKIDGEHRWKQYIGTVPHFEELDSLIVLYGVECCVVDAKPETHEAKKLRDRNPGIVWLCDYHSTEGSTKEISINDDTYHVVVDRTASMDESHADVLLEKVLFPKNAKTIDSGAFYEQMKAPTRVFDEEKNRYIWNEGTRADHYRHADNYEKIAMRISRSMGVKVWDL